MNWNILKSQGYQADSFFDDGFNEVQIDYSWERAKSWVEFFTYVLLGVAIGFVLFN